MLFDRSKTTFEVHTAIRTVEADLPVALKHTRDRLTQLDDLTERVARMQDRLRSSLAPSFLERALEQSGEAALARSIRRVEAPEEPTTRGSTARSSARAGSKGGGGGKDDDDDAWEAKLSKEEDEVARRLQARELDLTTDELASQAVAQWVGGAVARAEDAAAEDEAKRETRSRGRQRALQQRQREQRTVSDGGGAGAAAPGDGGEGGGAGAQLAESLRDAHHRPAAHGLINVLARVTADEDDPAASSAAGGLGLGLVPRGGTLPSLGFGLGGAGLAAGSVPAATWRHDDDLDPAAAAAAAAAAEAREANMRAAALRRAGLAGSLLSQGAGAQEAEARARLLHATAGGPSELRALTVPGTFGARMQLAAMEGEAGPAPPPRQQQGRQQAGARPPRSGGAAAAGGPAARGGPTPGAAAAAGASGPAAAAADRKALDSQTLAKQRLRRKGVPSAEAPAATAGRGMALLPMQPSDIRSHLRALGAPGSASQPSMLRGGLLPTSIRRVQAGDFQPASAGLPLEEQAEQADAEGTPEGAKPAAEEGAGSGPGPADGPPEPRALDPAPALDDGPAEEEAADDEAAAPVLITDRPLRRAPKVEAQVTWEEAQVDASESFGPPGPPQQVQVADKGHDWLAVRWMPPAFDGGSPVVDYVIRYNAIERRFPDGRPAAGEGMDDEPLAQEDEAEAEANADRGEAVPTVVAKPPYRTTQFVGADPIAQSGAVLRGLRPGVWYTDITVTAVTLAGGEGDACVPLEPVRTLSEPPLLSFPQEFELVEVTSRGFDLRWLPPHATHGQRIRHYRLSYTVHSSMLGHDQKPKSKRLVTIKVPAPRQRVTSQAPPRPPPGPAPLAAGLPVFAPLNPLTEADLVARADAEAASQKVRPGDCPYEGAEERGSEREVVARVRGLQGNQRVTGISLVAVSLETGRASAPLELGTDLVTLAPSRRQSVMAELQRVKAIRAHAEKNEDGADASAPLLVDTAFMTAALQRVEAGEYERRLWDELQGLPDAAAEARRKRAEAMRQRQLLLRAQQQARGAGRKQRGRRASISVRQATGQTLAPGGGGGDDDDDDDDALTKLSEAATEAERLAAQAEADMLELATIPVPRGVIEGQAAGRAGSPSRSRQAGPSGRAKLSTPGSRRQGRPASPASAISGLPSEAGSYDSGSDVEPSGATSTPVTDDLSGLDDRQLLRRAAERMEDGGGVGRLRRVQTFRVGRMHTWGRGEGGDIAVKDHDPGVAGAKGLRQQRQAKGLEVSRTAADRRQRAALERAEAMLAADEAAEAKKRQEAKDDVGSRAPSASAAAASASKQRSGDSGARGGDRARRASVASVEETFSVLAGWRPPEDPDSDSDAEPQGAAAFEAAVEAAQYKRDRRGSAVRGRRGSSAGKAVAKDGEAVTGKVRRGHRRASAARRRQIDTTGAKDEIARQARRRLRQREKERRAKRRMSIIAGRRDAPWLTAEQKDYLIRRQQFLERIQAMRKLAEEADAGRRAAEEEVRELARTSQSERARIGRILVEVSRAARGEAPSWVIMSRVRTGAPQEFDAGKLIQALADEAVALRSVLLARARRAWVASRRGRELATRCRVLIASADAKKAALMQLTRSMQAAERAQRGGGGAWLQRGFGLAMTQAKQAEAQEAGTTASAASAERGVALMTPEEKKTLRSLAFTAWVEKWREAKQEKAFLRSIILRMLRRQLAEGFGKWVTAAREVGEWWTSGGGLDGSSKGKHDPGGKGTRELGKAEGARQGMMATAARVLEDMGRGNEALQLQRKAERWQDTEEAADADEDSDAGSVVGDASAEEKRETKLRRAIGLGGGAADIISRRRALANKETSGALLLATGGAAAAAQAEAAQNAREFAVPGRLRLAQSLEERTLQRRLLRRLFKACTVWEPAPPNEAAILAAEEFRAQRQAEADAKARARRERAEKYKRVRLRQARRHQREERLQLAAKAGVRLELADEDPELASGSGSDAGDDAEGGPQGTPRARGAAATGGDMAIVVARPRPASPPPGLALSLDSAKPPASAASSLTASKAVTPYTEQVESDGGLVFEAAMGQAGGAGGGGAAAGDGRSSAAERPGTRSGLAQASDANTPFFAHVAGSAFFRAGNYQGAQKQYAKLAAVSEDSIAALRGRVRAIASQARHLARRVRVGVAKRIQASKAAAALPGGADGESAMDAGERAAFSADVTAGPASPKALPGADVLRSEAAGRFVVDSDGDSEEESEEDEDETDGLGPLGFRDASSVFDGNGSPRDSEALGELEARWNDDLPPPATVLGAALSAKARDFVKTQGDMQPNMSVGATPGAAGAGGFTAPPPSLRRMSSRGSMASSAGGGSGGAGTSGGPGLQRAMSSMSLSSLGSQDREAEVVRRGWGPLVAAGLVVGDALDAMVQLKARLVAATGALEAEELRRRALALRACECAAMAGDLAVALDGYSRLRQGLEREGDAAGAAVVCERECWLAARRGQLQGAKGWAKRAQNLWREVIEVRGEASRAALGLKLGTEIMWLVGGSGKVKGTDTWLFASVADARAVRLGQGRAEAARGLGRCVSVEECLCAITGDEAGAAQARMRRSQFGLGPGGDGFGVLHAAPAAVPAALLLDGAGSVSASAVAGESALAVWRPPGQASSGSGSLGAEASQARDAIRARREAAQSAQSAASSRKESSGPVGSTSKLGVRGLLEAAKERRRQSVAQAADSAGEAGGGGAPEDASGEGRAPGSAASAAGAGSRDAVALEQRLAAAAANLSALAVRLQKAVAKVLPDLALEQVSAAVPPLRAKVRACRRMIAGLEKAISEMQARRTELGDATEEDAALLAVLRSTTATHIDVAVAGGAAAAAEAKKARQRGAVVSTQRMTVAEARFLIQTRLEMAERERDELQRRVGVAEVRIRNLSDTLSDLSKELAASTGALASAALGRRAVRSACFYQWNALGNQVMGRGRVWAMDGAGGEVEVICPNCGGAQVMGGGRGRSPLTDEDLAGGGAGGARAKLLALRRARAERAAAASGGQTKTGVSSNAGGGRNRGAKAGKGAAADDAPWERTPLAKYVSANGRALRKSTSAVVGAARVAQSAAKLAAAAAGGAADGASAAAAAEGDNGEVDSFSLLTGGGAKSVGMEAVASEGRQVFDDEEDEEAEEREGIEAGSVQCSQCKFVLGGALLGLCPYMAAVQGDDVVIHRVFRGPGEAAAEERRYKGRMGEGRAETQELAPGQRPKKAAASEHPLARLRLLRERTQKRAALLEKLVGAAGRKNKSAAQAAAAALFREEEAGDDSDDEASAASALRAQLARAPPIVTKAVRVIPGNWKALLARGVRGLGRDGGLSRDKRMALLVAAGRMGNRTLVEHFAGAVEAGGGVPGKEAEEEAAEGQDAASKDKDKAKAKGKPAGGSAAADGKQDVQAVASRVARGLISVEDAEKERKRLEETHAAYLATLRAGHGRAVTCVAMTATRVFTGSADATIRAWNWRTGDVVGEMVGHRGTVTCLALDVDARTLLSGSSDGTARLWDTLSFRCLRTLRKHEGGITCVAIFRDMFVTGSADRSVGVWDLASKPLRNEAADELEALAEFKMKQEGDWAFQLREAVEQEKKLERKLDNDEASDDEEREAMGRPARGSESESINSDDLFETSSESSELSDGEDGEDEDSGDVSTTDSEDSTREARITVWEKEQRLLDRLVGDREAPRPNELKVRINAKGRLAGVGYKTFTRGGAYRARQMREKRDNSKLTRREREKAIKRGENRVAQARRAGGEDAPLEDEDELTLTDMFQNLRSNMRARRDALKRFQKMRVAEKRKRRRRRFRIRRLAATKTRRRQLQSQINTERRKAEQRMLSLQRRVTSQSGPGAFSEGDGVIRVTAESLGFDINMSADTLQAVAHLPRHNLLLDVHTAAITSVCLTTPFVVSGDAIGVVIIWDVVRAVPLRVIDTQPDMPLPPRTTLPMPRILQEDFSNIQGVVGVVRRRRKLPDGRVVTYTAGQEADLAGLGATGLSPEDLGGLTVAGAAAGKRDLAAEAASSSSEDEDELRAKEQQRLAAMSGRERAKERARILEGQIARRFFLEALTGLPTRLLDGDASDEDLGDEDLAARAIVQQAGAAVAAALPPSLPRGPRMPWDADKLWRLDPESLMMGRQPGEDPVDVKLERRERARRRRLRRKQRAVAIADGDFGDGAAAEEDAGADSSGDDDPIARADAAAKAAREAIKAAERRFPVLSLFADPRRVAVGVGSGEVQMFDLISLERVATLHPAEMREGEAVSGDIGRRQLRMLRGTLVMDSGKVMAAYNDGRVRRWEIYTGDGDEEAAVESEGKAGAGGGRRAAAPAASRKSAASVGGVAVGAGGGSLA
ncbi:hypothetical protein FNF27_06788 [Cafeteria roenbergensis]|uniref:Fibronectin type-III domain-containing protein n=1 Tax=Cafeteria roenbergensis TaxID=33653 RepID=A0A5A8DX10_CAFRO|nr:hypothetical protein FNF27_06788 [Cafeteria roenbergensis]